MSKLSGIILAAGQGTRMKSPLPKVLHPVAGEPMINLVLQALGGCEAQEIRVVIGYGENLLRQVLEPQGVICCKQAEQKGTAHAVLSAKPSTMGEHILIINGDHPLVTSAHLKKAYAQFLETSCDLMVLTTQVENPGNYGRIVRHHGKIRAIVEAQDASAETKKIKEVNPGIYLVKRDILETYLPKIHPHNEQGEYYLTDLVSLCIEAGEKVETLPSDPIVNFGVNTQKELALATKLLFREKCFRLMEEGVIIIDPENTYVEPLVQVGAGSILYPGCFIKGRSQLGPFTVVEPNAFIQDSTIGQSVQVRAGSYLEKAQVGDQVTLGPYARIRPQTQIGDEARIGNFVELKKVKFGAKSKANHLAYLGDTEVGENTNIGCGVITCNYAADKKKYSTKIGNNVFVGSDSQMIAPVEIEDDAIIASGSTINKKVPKDALALGRSRQVNKEGYAKKIRGTS